MSVAIADGSTLNRWEKVDGEIALSHIIPAEPLQIKLIARQERDWQGMPITHESLVNELQRLDTSAVLLLHVMVKWALDQGKVTVNIDSLIKKIGWVARSRQEYDRMRLTVWRWIQIFDSMEVIGQRHRADNYKRKGKIMDLTICEPLIRYWGKIYEDAQGEVNKSKVPSIITFQAGDWLDKWRDDSRILQYFGDMEMIASIPAGQPSGVWARCIALALNQFWREDATRADLHYTTEKEGQKEKKLTAAFTPFTRYQLLDLFKPNPWVVDVLNSSNPRRAVAYWDQAIDLLKNNTKYKMISYYKELDESPQNRQGKGSFWLKAQRLDIRPVDRWVDEIVEIQKHSLKGKAVKQLNG